MNLNEKIKDLRVEKNLTVEDLAKAINYSKTVVYYWERGLRRPNASALTVLANYFNVSVDYLIGNEESFPTVRGERAENLSEEEQKLLTFYRAIGKEAKMAIFTTAESFFNALPTEKRASYGY